MTYKELVEAVAALLGLRDERTNDADTKLLARAIIALIAERLREPSEEMKRAAPTSYPITVWEAMLADSPLYPPKEGLK